MTQITNVLFLSKFVALNIAFVIFIICIMTMSKKNYKNVPLFATMLLVAFCAYCFVIYRLI